MAILFTFRDFDRNLLRVSRRSNIFIFSFWCLTLGLNSDLTSNKPTHYLLDYGDFKLFTNYTFRKRCQVPYYYIQRKNLKHFHIRWSSFIKLLINLNKKNKFVNRIRKLRTGFVIDRKRKRKMKIFLESLLIYNFYLICIRRINICALHTYPINIMKGH